MGITRGNIRKPLPFLFLSLCHIRYARISFTQLTLRSVDFFFFRREDNRAEDQSGGHVLGEARGVPEF